MMMMPRITPTRTRSVINNNKTDHAAGKTGQRRDAKIATHIFVSMPAVVDTVCVYS